ncbi:hypothetical protein PACTADRAFT_31241 [Pachysolen tannophilus NRRL Y-2460]|uniref:CAP-Gly domain-containing protein n=1 Tax=Pachysolen tannophilus NRRL Y-2460 TaxID=669874 RepID=A0A1E4U1E5_PACTA|nr:hypothetical protein PACTADRAFT_31241 [Pachysolen tannophilus NRRL Y-2460]
MSNGVSLFVGQKIKVKGEYGIIRYIGETEFANGEWIGIELIDSIGKNNGSVNDVKYFELEKQDGNNYGIFIRAGACEIVDDENQGIEKNYIQNEFQLNRPTYLSEIAETKLNKSNNKEIEKLHNIIYKLQDKLKLMKEDIERLNNEKVNLTKLLTKSEENLERLTIDKELFNEKNELLIFEMEELNKKYLDLQDDFAALQEELKLNQEIENEILAAADDSNNNTNTDILHKRNKLMEIALFNLKNVSTDKENELLLKISSLESELSRLTDIEIKYNETLQKLTNAELIITQLKSQIDSTLETEKLIENLTEKNISLSETIKNLNQTVAELEQLQDLDENLAQNHAELENELKKELDSMKQKINQDNLLIKELKEKSQYLEKKLSNFRHESVVNIPNSEILHESSNINNNNDKNDKNNNSNEEMIELQQQLIKLGNSNFQLEIDEKLNTITKSAYLNNIETLKDLIIQHDLKNDEKLITLVTSFQKNSKILLMLSKILIDHFLPFPKKIGKSVVAIIKYYSLFLKISNFLKYFSIVLTFNNTKKLDDLIYFNNILNNRIEDAINFIKDQDLDNGLYIKFTDLQSNLIEIFNNNELLEDKKFTTREKLILKLGNDCKIPLDCSSQLILVIINAFIPNYDELSDSTAVLKTLITEISHAKALIDRIANSLAENEDIAIERDFAEIQDEFYEFFIKITENLEREFSVIGSEVELNDVVEALELDLENDYKASTFEEKVVELSHLKEILEKVDFEVEDIIKYDPNEPIWVSHLKDLKNHDSENLRRLKELDSLKQEVMSFSKVFKDKNRLIEELTLKITVLNQKLTSNEIYKANYLSLKNELNSYKEGNEKLLANLNDLIAQNNQQLQTINDLKSSKQSLKLIGDFDIFEEKKFNDQCSLISEIHTLRKSIQHLKSSAPAFSEELEWLKRPLTNNRKSQYNISDNIRSVYKQLMNMNENYSIIPIKSPTDSHKWQPKSLIPKYYISSMKDEYYKFEIQKNNFKF